MNEANDISAALSGEERQQLAVKLTETQAKFKNLPNDATPLERALIQLDISELMLALDLKEEAWNEARATFDTFVNNLSNKDYLHLFDGSVAKKNKKIDCEFYARKIYE